MGSGSDSGLHSQVKAMLVNALRLKVDPGEIANDMPLFGEGLGLDSVDALEIVIVLEKEFGARIPDAGTGSKVLLSVDSMVKFIEQARSDESA